MSESASAIISVHFPKAGGSAFASQLCAAFGSTNVLTSYDCDPVDPSNPLWLNPSWFLRRRPETIQPFLVVHGHIPIIKYNLVPHARRIVLLRDPVQNIISIYFYWMSLFEKSVEGHAIFEFVKKNRLSLLEVAEIPRLRRLMSQTYFGDFDMDRFDVIGSYERRPAFVATVSSLLGKPLLMDEKKNVTPFSIERSNVMNDTRLLTQLNVLLQDDIRFYQLHTRKL